MINDRHAFTHMRLRGLARCFALTSLGHRLFQAKFSINDESRKVADNILIKEDSYSAQTFVLDVPKLERTLALLHDATGAIRQSFTALAQIQIERRTHSVAQVESEQHKLETQVRVIDFSRSIAFALL